MYIKLNYKGRKNMFVEYLESKISENSLEAENLEKNYRHDDAVFVKIKINVYDVCKTVFGVFKKTKPQDDLYNEYINKLDEFERIWSSSAENAKKFGDSKKIAAEEAKLFVLAEIKKKFIETRGE